MGISLSEAILILRLDDDIKQKIRTLLQLEKCSDYFCLVGLFITDLFKGKEPRRTKYIPKVPKTPVFTRNFVTRKEYDYGKVHH